MVHNHGDRVRPLRIGLWDPFQMAFYVVLPVELDLLKSPLKGDSRDPQ